MGEQQHAIHRHSTRMLTSWKLCCASRELVCSSRRSSRVSSRYAGQQDIHAGTMFSMQHIALPYCPTVGSRAGSRYCSRAALQQALVHNCRQSTTC
jgi:hypothetical protein